MSLVPFIGWLVASVFYAYQYILRVMPNIMMVDILQQFHIDPATFGQLSGVYYVGYALMHIPIGSLLDRYGPQRVMPIALCAAATGLLPFIYADFWIYPIIGRLLIGIGSSAAILSVFHLVRITFPERHFARMLSISVTIGLIGAIYGGAPVLHLCRLMGYKSVIGLFAVVGIFLAILSFLVIPSAQARTQRSVVHDVWQVLTNVRVMATCFCAGLMVGPLEGFADVWGTEFLKRVYGFESGFAATAPSLIFVGMCIGAPLLSLIAEKTNAYLGTIVASGIFMASTFFLLIAGGMTTGMISVLFFGVGVCCAYQILAIYKASTYVSAHVAGITTAIANMIIMTFGYLFHTVIGIVITSMGGIESRVAFQYGMLVIPLALTVGSLGFIICAVYDNQK